MCNITPAFAQFEVRNCVRSVLSLFFRCILPSLAGSSCAAPCLLCHKRVLKYCSFANFCLCLCLRVWSQETANTLKFATRAKLVRVAVSANESLDDKALVKRWVLQASEKGFLNKAS